MVALDTRTTKSGVELVLGPEVGEHRALVPGTPIEISLSGTQIRARFTWPEAISGERPPKRRNITLVPSRRSAKSESVPSASSSKASRPAGESRPAGAATLSGTGAKERIHEPAGSPSGRSSEEKPVMSPAPSIFDKLAALDALADTAEAPPGEAVSPATRPVGEKVTALPQEAPRKQREPEATAAPTAPQVADPVVALLADLKHDIAQIKHEQAASLAPREEQQLYGLLADLRRDIELLKRHEAAHEPPPGERQLHGMLAELRRDIDSLKRQEADHAMAAGERQLYGMLADLRRDIEVLKRQEAEVALPPGERQLYGMLAELRRDIESLKHHEATPAPQTQSEAHLYGMLAELKRDIRVLKEHEAEHAAPSPERALYAMLAELKRDIHALQEHADDVRPARSALSVAGGAGFDPGGIVGWMRAQTQGQSLLSLLAMALVPILVLLMLANNGSRGGDQGLAPVAQLPALPPAVTSPVRPVEAPAPSPVFDALAAGTVSPKGVNAAGLPASDILARINAERQAGQGRLGAEGEFWMKRYLIASLGDNNSARVLTQLGTIYAEAGPGADYAKARQLWEVAGGLGDPVAMCFLGSLYDSGLGVAANRRTAMQWYERARDAGGCAGAERLPAR